jgi:AraC-like DNA-binding protein
VANVLLLADSPAALDGVRRAVNRAQAAGTAHTLRRARSWAELSELASVLRVGVAFVDAYHGGAFAAAEIRRLRERHPALELVAYADFAGRPAWDPFALALLGVRAVLPGSVHRWLEPVLRSPLEPRTVPELARRAGCSPRTLRRTLAAAGLPSPEQLLAWRRVLHAARLLEDPGRSVESVARTLELSSGAALRKTLRTLLGLRPGELAVRGGVRLVATHFLAACGEGEAPHAHPGRARVAGR